MITNKSSRTPKQRAFTLPELLICILILAFAGILLTSAFARPGPSIKAWQCMNNLRQLTAAWKTYAYDNNDTLVAAQSGMAGRPLWVTGIMDYSLGNVSNIDTNQDIVKSPLWKYCGTQANLFRCPSDPSVFRRAGIPLPRVRSYSMGGQFGTGEWLDQNFNQNQKVWRTYAKAAEIVIPAKTFIFLDEHPDSINDSAFQIACTGADSPASARIIDYPASYHDNGSCCFSFADGRSEMHKWIGRTIKPPIGSPSIQLNVNAGESWVDIQWIAQNTTVRR
jgi:prepilin-type N-terminal cleavage/methylation domain-containing protein